MKIEVSDSNFSAQNITNTNILIKFILLEQKHNKEKKTKQRN